MVDIEIYAVRLVIMEILADARQIDNRSNS